jgi:hypothetical protein
MGKATSASPGLGGFRMSAIPNMLLANVEYQETDTRLGHWRRFVYPNGMLFEEFVSHRRMLGMPLLHFTRGKCPETGKRVTARGVIAIGRFALGLVALGHVSAGLIAIGQVSAGILLGFGQVSTGAFALGQLAIGSLLGIGQFATGYATIGQVAFGKYVLAQVGFGENVWDTRGASPAAIQFFKSLMP